MEKDALLGAAGGDAAGGDAVAGTSGSRIRDVVVLGAAFMLLFSAFTVAQNLATSVFIDDVVGYWALGSLYIVFALASLVAGRIVRFTGRRVALFLGGATYVWYTAATSLALTFAETDTPEVRDQLLLMIPSAILLGLGAAVLWTAQGSYLTLCASEHNLGYFNGVFFFLFIMNQLVGNVGAALILDIVDEGLMFNIMAGVGAVGVLSFALLRPVTREAAEAEKEQPAGAQASTTVSEQLFERPVGDRYKQVVRLVLKVDMLLLAPAIIYTGFTQAFFPGQIPLFIYNFNGNNDLDYDSSIKLYVMACLGACSSFGSLVFGRVSDRFGRLPVLALAGLFHGCGYVVLLLVDATNRLDILLPVASLFGLGDAIMNTQLYSILGFLFRNQAATAFAAFKLLQSMSTGILFFLSDAMTRDPETCPLAAKGQEQCPNLSVWMPLMLVSLSSVAGGLIALRRRGTPLDARSAAVALDVSS